MTTFLLQLYKFMLRLYPGSFYAMFGLEMTDVFAEKLAAAHGSRDRLAVFGREVRHWPGSLLREYWSAQQAALNAPNFARLSGWGTAVAALPYLLIALIFAVLALFGSPAQVPVQGVLVGAALLFLAVAWWQRWPAWSASWLGFLAFLTFYMLLPQYVVLGPSETNTTGHLLAVMFSELLYFLPLFCVFYWLVGRWPRAGAVVLLAPIGFSWLLHMEFVPANLTTAVFIFTWLWLAVMGVLLGRSVPPRRQGWVLGLAALVIGLLAAYAGQFWVNIPREGSLSRLMENFLAEFVPTLLPLVAILLLHTLRRRLLVGNGRSALRAYRLLFWGIVGVTVASPLVQRFYLPGDLAVFQGSMGVVVTAVLLLSLLGIGWSAWRLGKFRPGWLLLALAALFPVIFHNEALSFLLVELPVMRGTSPYLLYETLRLGGRIAGLIWLGLAAWLLGRTPRLRKTASLASS